VHHPNHMLEVHLRELLRLLVPTTENKELKIDGYKLLNNRHSVFPLYPFEDKKISKPSGPLDLYEPRIGFIQHLLESLLSLIDMEADGKTVEVDGFRLKNLDHWLSPGGNGATDILAHAASRCNLSCRFCYNKGNTPILKPGPRDAADEYQEIKSRIKHYLPRARLNIFPNMRSPGEALSHPHILDILNRLRRKTSECFRISTNGSTLTPQMIGALSEFMPVYLDISLNSSSPGRRRWLMNDPDPQIVLNSLGHLKHAGIPYSLVIVPWPFPSTEVMINDLSRTIDFAGAHHPTLVQISLPGYSCNLSPKTSFSTEDVWNELKIHIRKLRNRIDCPIVIRPGLFEEYTDPDKVNDPVLIGAIKNSPMELAGVRKGDRILKINGIPVKSKCQARSLLTILHQSDLIKSSVTLQRNQKQTNVELDLLNFGYPYSPQTATHLGAVFSTSGIPREWSERLWQTIDSRGAKCVLLLTSRLVRPSLEKLILSNGRFSNIDLHIQVPENRHFGGNIFMGDLLVVEDFIEAAREFMDKKKVRPDLVMLPSSPFHLSGWGRDLTGRVYLDIERCLGIPVALVECDPIFD